MNFKTAIAKMSKKSEDFRGVILCLLFLILSSIMANSQESHSKIIGNTDPHSLSSHQTSDGGYLLASYSTAFGMGYNGVNVIRFDGDMDTLWAKNFKFQIDQWDESIYKVAITETSNGEFVLTFSCGYDIDYYNLHEHHTTVLWLDANGNIIELNRTPILNQKLVSSKIIESSNGDILISANRPDSTFNILNVSGVFSAVEYSNDRLLEVFDFVEKSNGNYLLVGRVDNGILLVELDVNLNVVDVNEYYINTIKAMGVKILITPNNDIVLAYNYVENVPSNIWSAGILKLNQDKTIQWAKEYDLISYYNCVSLLEIQDGSFILSANDKIIKLSSTGVPIWAKRFVPENVFLLQPFTTALIDKVFLTSLNNLQVMGTVNFDFEWDNSYHYMELVDENGEGCSSETISLPVVTDVIFSHNILTLNSTVLNSNIISLDNLSSFSYESPGISLYLPLCGDSEACFVEELITEASCDTYTYNNETYTETGIYNQVFTSSAGCDSIVSLDLTIKQSSSNSITVTVCDDYFINHNVYDESGVYTIMLENSVGCDSVVTLNLTIEEIDLTIEQVDDNTLLALESASSYQWIECSSDFEPIDGATAQSFECVESGVYAVIITKGECSTTSECVEVLVNLNEGHLGVENQNINSLLNIYPNPNSGHFKVEFGGIQMPISLRVHDVLGCVIEQIDQYNGSSYEFSLPQVQGVYFVSLHDSKGQEYTQKFVIW